MKQYPKVSSALAAALLSMAMQATADSVARTWNEENLAAVRLSFPDPPVHARNLFHVSVAMYDAWAAYDPEATGYIYRENTTFPEDVEAARREAISHAAYRMLRHRYITVRHPNTPVTNALQTQNAIRAAMVSLGYDPNDLGALGNSPSAVGNRVA